MDFVQDRVQEEGIRNSVLVAKRLRQGQQVLQLDEAYLHWEHLACDVHGTDVALLRSSNSHRRNRLEFFLCDNQAA